MSERAIDRSKYEHAAELLLAVQSEGAPAEAFAEMLAWCDADPANKLAMERMEEAWAVAGDVEAVNLRSNGPGSTKESRNWRRLGQAIFGESRRMAIGAAAFTVLMVAVGLAVLGSHAVVGNRFSGAGERLATTRGAQETAKLPDGSAVDIGAKSAISVVYSPQNRTVFAEDGEAFYHVAKDRNRPFVVRAGPLTVTAVGTAFNVRRVGESVSVIVTEGTVDVRVDQGTETDATSVPQMISAIRAEAGQRVVFDRGRLSQSPGTVAPDVATGWREGRLQFIDEPLRLVVATVNRYSERELLISDPSIEELRFTGTVFENGIDTWLQGVATVFPVRIVEVNRRRVMLAPAHSPRS